jgi:hypothetical protein
MRKPERDKRNLIGRWVVAEFFDWARFDYFHQRGA